MSGPLGSQQWMYASGGFYDHTIDNSLRFEDGDTAYLTKTPASASNRKTWTWSGWVKRGNLGEQGIFYAQTTGAGAGNSASMLLFSSSNTLQFATTNSIGGTVSRIDTSAVFRDTSAWYHIVLYIDSTQASSTDAQRLYVNGVLQNLSIDTHVQNTDHFINAVQPHYIGFRGRTAGNFYFDGYMAEVNFIDGQALDPTSFGETKSGIWIPKDTSGLTFGTNGFRLAFGDSAAIGDDTSGNTNDYTANNLVASDVVLDSPTNNFATLNPLATGGSGITFAEGNLKFTNAAFNTGFGYSSFEFNSGKWYCEARVLGGSDPTIGWWGVRNRVSGNYAIYFGNSGQKWINGSASSYGATYTTGDIIGIAYDADTGDITFYKNGSSQGTFDTGLGGETVAFYFADGASDNSLIGITNFGQDSTFGNNTTAGGNADENGYGDFKYAPPSGFLALCSANLPTGAIDTAADETPEDYFKVSLHTGTGSQQAVTGIGFAPDFRWTKSRGSAYSHILHDNVRGETAYLQSNNTNSENTLANMSLDSDGFTVHADDLGDPQVSWLWKANGAGVSNTDGSIASTVSVGATSQQNWFSIASYTGNATAGATIGHGLGVAPDMIIVKSRDNARDWRVYHSSLGSTYTMDLNTTLAVQGPNSAYWNSTDPTSSVFSVGSVTTVNGSGEDYIAYCFANAEGLCKVGSYTGNGSTDGTFVYTGFRPKFFLWKRTDAVTSWGMVDAERDPYNVAGQQLFPNSNSGEGSYTILDFTSNGIKMRNTFSDTNASGGSYIYLSIAEQPFKYANAR